VTLTATNSSQPMLVFVRGRWEILQTSESDPGHSDVGTDEPLSELAAGHRQQHR